ncbi:solute carrier family 15 member 1-like [Styela clava]
MPTRRGLVKATDRTPLTIGSDVETDEDEKTPKSESEGYSCIPWFEKPYPKHVFFILGNEFCERYSYYGMRTILVLYLKYYLTMDDDTSTAVYHAFTVLAYLFPLLGAFIADSWWGKYKTILYLSIVYAIGMLLITMGACPPIGLDTMHLVLSMIGLFVIAIGTGGIKPCVSSFGGDQFDPEQEQYRRSFFSLFYFAINAGSLVSTIVSPIIRDDVHCFGRDDCYALAFGIPAALMVVAIITFIGGTSFYTIKEPEGNVFAEVFKGMGSAIKHRWNTPRSERNKDHWMDYALVDTSYKMVRDTKYVLRVLILYIPLPLFWTLFDQQGSRWTLQATRMNGYVGAIQVKPDQMQVFNPLLIVTMIPLFEATLYPCLRKYNINFSPLRRMTLGMILAGISFILAAGVQMEMDKTLTVIPEAGNQASFRVINGGNCKAQIWTDIYPNWSETGSEGGDGLLLNPGAQSNTLERFVNPSMIETLEPLEVKFHCVGEAGFGRAYVTIPKQSTVNLVIDKDGDGWRSKVFNGIFEKSESGAAIVRVFNALDYNATITGLGNHNLLVTTNNISEKVDIDRKTYTMMVYKDGTNIKNSSYYVDTGGDYTILVWNNGTTENEVVASVMYTDVYPNTVNLFWMIPQYFVITLGEVFLSVTGLEFSYSQAPTSMKSVLASFWLLTVSLGNIIVLIIAEAKFVPNQADEYFLFAGLIGVAAIIFIILAIRYEYVDESEFYETQDDPLDKKEESTFAEDEYHGISADAKKKAAEVNGEPNKGFEDDYNTAF